MSDIDTVVMDSLKVLDPNRPIREADIVRGNEKPRQMAGALLSNTNDKAATSVLLIAMSVRLK